MKHSVPYVWLLWLFLPLLSCHNSPPPKAGSIQASPAAADSWAARYDHIEATDLPDNVVDMISNQWMVVTSGQKDSFNSMTVNWGAIGYIWNHPAAFIFIRNSRYTYPFLQKEGTFTLCVFTEQYRGAMRILGTKSGRQSPKIKESGLTVEQTPSGLLAYKEARMIVECHVMMEQGLDYNKSTPAYRKDIFEGAYKGNASQHQMFIAEITNIWLKK